MELYKNKRLPKYIYPINYNITIIPDLNKFEFTGKCIIQIFIDTKYEHNKFLLNCKNLNIENVSINNNKVSFEYDNELLILQKPAENNNTITIDYKGKITDDLMGFYKSKYTINNEDKYICSTQFEPTGARLVFPCFDEPCFKATFDVVLITNKKLTVLSNTSIKSEEETGRNKITIFKTTPKMSTYLLAFVIGEFDKIEKINKNNIKLSVYGIIGSKDKLPFSLDILDKSLLWFESWFNIKYELDKLDLVGIPDFSAGAMENWGLITFRQEYLLCDQNTLLQSKQNIVKTICHEMSHQWFGNLVTMEWWSYLWLNESMATYFGWKVTDELYPEWNIWNDFLDTEYSYAMSLDSLKSSHPIEVDIYNVDDINKIFDAISYSKGSCLIRFLEDYLGLEFKNGLRKYMIKNKYGNTTSDDLWDVFGNDVKNIMNTWTKQTGFPIITVEKNNDKIRISQSRFLRSGKNDDTTIWKIPLKIYYEDHEDDIIISDKYVDIDFKDIMIINPDKIGFYIVQYLVETYKFDKLSDEMKRNIIDDSYMTTISGYKENNFMKILKNMKYADLDDNLWMTILYDIKSIKMMLNRTKIAKKFDDWIDENILFHVMKKLDKLNYINKYDGNNKLMNLLMEFAGELEQHEIINYANDKFNNNIYIGSILKIVAINADMKEFNKMIYMLMHDGKNDPHLRLNILNAFCNMRNTNVLNIFINKILLNVKKQDVPMLITRLSQNKYGTLKIWRYCVNNWDKIEKIYNYGSSEMNQIIKGLAYGFNNNEEYNEYINFFNNKINKDMTFDQSSESIQNRIYSVDVLTTIIKNS